jgi:hypothetical protein
MKKKATIIAFLAMVASRGVMKTESERMGTNSIHRHQLGIFPPEIDFRFPPREPIYL